MATGLTAAKRHRTHDGWTTFYRHDAVSTGTPMRFGVFTPPQAERHPCPVVYLLAGLTCNEETFLMKAGAQRAAALHGLILVAPDTSPRGAGLPGEDDSWDFGTGAGFYLNATATPWNRHYRMEDYIIDELPEVVAGLAPVQRDRQGLLGHSMGGHGALVLGLRHPERFRSLSAFAPIAAPMDCPWGEKAFTNYLGSDRTAWAAYDASRLLAQAPASGPRPPILVDQGTSDEFLDSQLMPQRLQQVAAASIYPLQLRYQEGYDHSYYFMATFIDSHMAHHARCLGL